MRLLRPVGSSITIYSGLVVFGVIIIKIEHSIVSGVQRLGIVYFTGWIHYVVLKGSNFFFQDSQCAWRGLDLFIVNWLPLNLNRSHYKPSSYVTDHKSMNTLHISYKSRHDSIMWRSHRSHRSHGRPSWGCRHNCCSHISLFMIITGLLTVMSFAGMGYRWTGETRVSWQYLKRKKATHDRLSPNDLAAVIVLKVFREI